MFIKVNPDITIRLQSSDIRPYEMVINDGWSEIVIYMDLADIEEFRDCLEEFVDEAEGRRQS